MSTQLVLEREPAADVILLESRVPDKIIWPVAGGKGGTGKSTLTANLGVGLSLLGYKVILVDGDLGGADLHLFFDQISPSRSLGNFLARETASLEDVLLPTPSENLRLVCGGNEYTALANLPFLVKEKLLRHIQALDADYVLIDLGAGTAYNTLDFFTMSNDGIVVCTPEPHARVDAYGFIKNTVYRKLRRLFARHQPAKDRIEAFARTTGRKSGRLAELIDDLGRMDPAAGQQAADMLDCYRPKLLLNRVRNKRQIAEAQRFIALVEQYLSTRMDYIGYVRSDSRILDACERRRPLLIDNPKAPAARDLCSVIMKGLGIRDRLHRFESDDYRKMADVARAAAKFW